MLEDVQARRDHRHLPIDEVGITGIRYPVAVPTASTASRTPSPTSPCPST